MWDFDRIAFGGDYYPEQWDQQTLIEDIDLMNEAGVNLVSLGVFAWSKLEPEEGNYQFDWLENIVERLYANGIFVDLGTATASPPAWMARNYPQTLPVTSEGTTLEFGSRQQYCPSNPIFRQKASSLTERLAERFGQHPAVKLWHVSNELGAHTPMCYCSESARAFRRYLADKYQTIENLNRAWGTEFWSQSYNDFDQINPPSQTPTFPNPAQQLDWRRFSSQALLETYLSQAEVIRKHSPNIPITTNFMGAFEYADYFQWAKHMDVVSDDSYPDPANPASAAQIAFEADLARSYKNRPFLLMEQAPSAVQWKTVNSVKRPGQNLLWSLQRVAHGADGILHFQWRQSQAGAEQFHSGMLPHSGRESRIFAEAKTLGQTLKKIGSVRGSAVKTKVALVWDFQSDWAVNSAVWYRPTQFAQATRAWHRALFEAGYTVDFLHPESLNRVQSVSSTQTGGSGNREYGLVIVPELFMMTARTVEELKRIASAGTQIIVAGPSSIVDENLTAYNSRKPNPLEDLTGVKVIEPWPLSEPELRDRTYPDPDIRVHRITRAVGAPAQTMRVELDAEDPALAAAIEKICTPKPALQGKTWAEHIEILDEDVRVLARYQAGGAADLRGQAALTMRPIGMGACYYLSTDLDEAGKAAVINLACLRARIHPPVYHLGEVPDGLEVVRRGSYLFLLNHADSLARVSGIEGKEIITSAAVTGQVLVPARSAAVVELSANSLLAQMVGR